MLLRNESLEDDLAAESDTESCCDDFDDEDEDSEGVCEMCQEEGGCRLLEESTSSGESETFQESATDVTDESDDDDDDDEESRETLMCHSVAVGDASGRGWMAVLSDGSVARGGRAPKAATAVSEAGALCVSLGPRHCCCATGDGSDVACWSCDDDEELVVPERPPWIRPGVVVLEVACAAEFTLARTSELEVFGWGGALYGGGGKCEPSTARVHSRLVGVPVVRIAAGKQHACAVGLAGSAFGWGANSDGRCGHNERTVLWSPSPVNCVLKDGERFVDAACGDTDSFFLVSSGRIVKTGGHAVKTAALLPGAVALSAWGSSCCHAMCGGGIVHKICGDDDDLPDHFVAATFLRPKPGTLMLEDALKSPSLLSGAFLAAEDDDDDDGASVVGCARRKVEDAGFTDAETDDELLSWRAFSIDDEDVWRQPVQVDTPARRWRGSLKLDATRLCAAIRGVKKKSRIARLVRRCATSLEQHFVRGRVCDDDVGRCLVALLASLSALWPDIASEPERRYLRAAIDVARLVHRRTRASKDPLRSCGFARTVALATGGDRAFRRRLVDPMKGLFEEAARGIRVHGLCLPCGANDFALNDCADEAEEGDDDDVLSQDSSISSGEEEDSDDSEDDESTFEAAQDAACVLDRMRGVAAVVAPRREILDDYLCPRVDALGTLVDSDRRAPRAGPLLVDFNRWRSAADAPEEDDDESVPQLVSASGEDRQVFSDDDDDDEQDDDAQQCKGCATSVWFLSSFAWAFSARTRRELFAIDEKRRREHTHARARARILADHATQAGLDWISPFMALLAASGRDQPDAFADDGDRMLESQAFSEMHEMMLAMSHDHPQHTTTPQQTTPRGSPPPVSREPPFFMLRAKRGDTLALEALDALGRATDEDLCRRELRVAFDGEPGVDEGGVKKEFFELVAPPLFDPGLGMFVATQTDDRTIYFNPRCDWYLDKFDRIGTLCGLAFAHGIPLAACRLPTVAFKKLLAWRNRTREPEAPLRELLEDLDDVDEALARGLRQLLAFEPKESVEAAYQRAFVYGDPPTPLCPDGESLVVTHHNRRAFARQVAVRVLHTSVQDQFSRFATGFWRTAAKDAFVDILEPEDFRDCCTGGTDQAVFFDWAALRAITRYESWPTDDPDADDHPVIHALWDAVAKLDPPEATDFLKFITGSKASPIGGLGALKPPEHAPFTVQRMGPDSNRLPTAHVCFHTLL